MAGLSRIHFDSEKRDFVINGVALLHHLAKHEGVDPSMYQVSLGAQPNTPKRLLGVGDPDLVDGHVALYVCGLCGDYDGSPIGARVTLGDSQVAVWSEMGWEDVIRGWRLFNKVRGYRFDRSEYLASIGAANVG